MDRLADVGEEDVEEVHESKAHKDGEGEEGVCKEQHEEADRARHDAKEWMYVDHA